MGLDVSAYRGIKLIDTCDSDEWETKHDWDSTIHLYPAYVDDSPYPKHLEGGNLVPNGVYTYEEAVGFRAGSYSGYNNWREALSIFALGVRPTIVWHDAARFQDRPFYYLINFSDCEGIITGNAAKALLADFDAHSEQCHSLAPDLVYTYDNFHAAFRLAVQDGFVYFH